MTASSKSVEPLLSQVDDWFQDLTLDAPIGQFSIDNKDQVKLSAIVRTTTNWFKQFTHQPPITYEGIEEEDNANSYILDGNELAQAREDSHLDSLAKDLELLLEEEEEEEDGDKLSLAKNERGTKTREQECFTYNVYETEELTLLDLSIGACCTIEPDIKRTKLSAITRSQQKRLNEASATSLSDQYNKPTLVIPPWQSNDKNWAIEKKSRGAEASRRNNINDCDLNNNTVQCPMPPDHDYLPKPRAKPLMMSNRAYLRQRNGAKMSRSKESSVLNTGAMKRFARFSAELEILSSKHANNGVNSNLRLVAIENS